MAIEVNGQYLLTELAGVPYLLPFGQRMAEHFVGMRLNETAALIWKGLKDGFTEEEIVRMLAVEYEAEDTDISTLQEDVRSCLHVLKQRNIIQEKVFQKNENKEAVYFRIGDLCVAYDGPSFFYHHFFEKFSCKPSHPDASVTVRTYPPTPHQNGYMLVRNRDVQIMDVGQEFLFLFPMYSSIYEMHAAKDGAETVIYCRNDMKESQYEEMFHALRFAFLIAVQQKRKFMLHSASILYKGKAWLFSGSSGTGKSTQANLWHELYGTPYINGDLNLIGIENEKPVVYGQPWCGTSGICTPENYPLGGIIFLKQAKENRVLMLAENMKILSLLQRSISPMWNENQTEMTIQMAVAIAARTNICTLHCTKGKEAAYVMKSVIDRNCGDNHV